VSVFKSAAGIALSLLILGPAAAQEAEGDWGGWIHTPGSLLHVGIRIHRLADGAFAASFDSFDQGRWGVPFTTASVTGDKLTLTMSGPGARYEAVWTSADRRWVGTWKQAGLDMPLDLESAVLPVPPNIDHIEGDWDGVLVRKGARLRMSLHFHHLPTGGVVNTIEGIDFVQTAGITDFAQDGRTISLKAAAADWSFSGTIGEDGKSIGGRWGKSVEAAPLSFTLRKPGTPGPVLNRPQTPQRPYPYREEQISFSNTKAGATLSGTLTLPKGQGPFPAVILIGGSGPTTRDEPFFGHRPFLVLADFLTRRGFAVLRYDKRGSGASTGDYANATTADLADDAQAGVDFLKGRSDIDGRRVGLIGHSEGALVAPLVAAKHRSAAFLVLLGASGQKGGEIIPEQIGLEEKAEGMAADEVARQVRVQKEMIRLVRTESNAQAIPAIRDLLVSSGSSQAAADRRAALMTSPWGRFFIDYDPVDALRKITCPVLVIDGDRDVQVPARANLKMIKAALAGDRDVQIKEMPNLNHVLQMARTGSAIEYAANEETIAPAALDLIGDWVGKKTHATTEPVNNPTSGLSH
jgi:pimeloyl-ACP methyl ester carboxylesterase